MKMTKAEYDAYIADLRVRGINMTKDEAMAELEKVGQIIKENEASWNAEAAAKAIEDAEKARKTRGFDIRAGDRVKVVKGKSGVGAEGTVFYAKRQEKVLGFNSRFGEHDKVLLVRIGIATSDRKDAAGKYADVVWTYSHNVKVL